jgi:hypothetical protein
LEVYAGFIVGFDSDGPEIFEAQRSLISSLPIPLAMIGLLTALPGTALWRRLEREGRIRSLPSGDQFDRPNFQPTLDERLLIAGYRDLLSTIYAPGSYYERCEQLVDALGGSRLARDSHSRDWATLLRAMFRIGVLAPHRRHFWRLLFRTARRSPQIFSRAVALAIKGEHLIRYTREDVLPRLEASLGQLAAVP